MTDLPEYYFRVRENGALVFRVDTENRQRRIEMDQIAVVNIRNGEIKPHGDRSLSDEDLDVIQAWMAERAELLARRDIDDIFRAVDYMNTTAQWAQSKASPEQLDAVTDALLLAMHDLRSVLVRKKAERLMTLVETPDGERGRGALPPGLRPPPGIFVNPKKQDARAQATGGAPTLRIDLRQKRSIRRTPAQASPATRPSQMPIPPSPSGKPRM